MPTHVMKSTDAGAPTLNGTAGALITVLDALLVNGYNTKTITITRSGTTATANCTTHGFVTGQVVVVSGADQADYNVTAKITVTDANNFTYTVANSPATPATGTISAKVAPLGWTKSYSGTNKAVYRQKTGTNQLYMRIDDTAAQSAYMRGYETMSDVDNGTNPFPTAAQLANGLGLYKSVTADSTARLWYLWSNGKIFYFWSVHGSSGNRGNALAFGDFHSYVTSDAYNTVAMGETTGTNVSASAFTTLVTSNATASGGMYVARPYTGLAGAIQASKPVPDYSSMPSTQMSTAGSTYPDSIIGGLLMMRVRVGEPSVAGVRGRLPGLWMAAHIRPLSNLDTFSGAVGTPLEGRTFEYINTYNSASGGDFILETSNGGFWDSIDG